MGGSDLTPQIRNLDLSTVSGFATSAAGCYAEVLTHSGGGPRLLWITRHGGAGTTGNRRNIFQTGGSLNLLATRLNASSMATIDVASIGTPQFIETGSGGPAHLTFDPMTHCPDGVKYSSSPRNIDFYAAAVRALIQNRAPDAVVIGGQSWGNILGLPEMMRAAMPASVVGYLGYQPIPDLRTIPWEPRSEKLSWKVHQGTYGATTADLAAAVSAADRQALSFNWYLEQGNVANYRECFFVFSRVGNHIMPYGDTAHPGSDPHDSHQFLPLITAMKAAGLPFEQYVYNLPSQPENSVDGLAAATAIETWMADFV